MTEQVLDANGNLTDEKIQRADIARYVKQTVTGQTVLRGLGSAKDVHVTWLTSDVLLKDGRTVRIREVDSQQK